MAFHFNQGDRPLPGYTIQRGVGRGGFGEVYYATSDGGKEVALKYLRENPQVELRGVMHCLNLKSPYLVAIHDVKQNADGEYFVIMEYVSGPSLRDLMNSEPSGLGAQKAAYFLREIGKGLAYLHDRGIVHRDLKPGNIFYEDGYVKIGDYGLAKIMAASQHSGQTVSVGTVHYMAPEVGSGNYDRTIDIYALGVMLYEMLLGKVPFSGATMGEVLMKHLTAQPNVDELPAPFPNVIRKALAKDPKDRYQTVQEMMTEVFSVQDVSRTVESMDSLSLTRMAAAVASKIKTHAQDGGGVAVAGGSSNVTMLATPKPPPLIVERGKPTPPPGQRPDLWDQVWRPEKPAQSAFTFPQRNRLTTGLLGLFLGPFGVHRFYTGYNAIGVFQILVTCFTGVGALWGIIEGIQILSNGNFKDSLGRPLLEGEWKSRPGARSMVVRAAWGFIAFGTFAGALATACVATFASPELELGVNNEYYWNSLHGLYFVSSGLLGIFFFALWKAAHRGGAGHWRSIVRPSILCAMVTMMAAGLTWDLAVAAGSLQLVGYFTVATAAFVFAVVWLLRGPTTPGIVGDAYWNLAWAKLFALVAVFSICGLVGVHSAWRSSGKGFELTEKNLYYEGPARGNLERRFSALDIDLPGVQMKFGGSGSKDESEESVEVDSANARRSAKLSRETKRQVREEAEAAGGPMIRYASIHYNHLPLAAWVLALLTIGSFSEARYRKCLARRALSPESKHV
ncbi:MAG TPA: protein kinase [Phycisphaerae bacterium]|nr:protein kinase [Phycisphaerae bacterium]